MQVRAPSSSPSLDSPAPIESRKASGALGKEFEAAFLAEMLKHSGFDDAVASDSGFGGEAMASLMVDEVARLIVERRGIGVAELIQARLDRVK